MKQISFKCSRADHLRVDRIVDRTIRLAKRWGISYDRIDASMDVLACHCNGCPLDLTRLLVAPEFDFAHDVFGIREHIDRRTGHLADCFLPRCALPEAA